MLWERKLKWSWWLIWRHDLQVVACRIDFHKCLVNSVALALADIHRDTPDPEGGIIWRDGQGGTSSSSPLAIIFMIICGYSIQLDFRNYFHERIGSFALYCPSRYHCKVSSQVLVMNMYMTLFFVCINVWRCNRAVGWHSTFNHPVDHSWTIDWGEKGSIDESQQIGTE